MTLSDMQCRNCKPKSKPYKLADGGGLYLEVMPSGSKYWRQKYRLHKKEKRIAHGVYPDVSLAEARDMKSAVKEQLKKGLDPLLVRLEQKQTAVFAAAQTFELIGREWHGKQIDNWDPNYSETVLHRLEKYLFQDLGLFPVKIITPIIVLSCLQKIEKTAPQMARRIKSYCHQIFIYAIATNRATSDPTYGLEHALKKFRKTHFASIGVDKLPNFLLDLHEYKIRLTRQTFLAIKLMFLTFIRTSELIKAEWPEIDFENAMWAIPGHRMKKDRPHLVPLSRQAIEVLQELKELNGHREFVFPGIFKPRKHMSNGTILVAIKRMGYNGRMTGHGFRSLAMGILREKLGYEKSLVKKQLSHEPDNETDAAYDRAEFLPQRKEMMQRYADYLDEVYVSEMTKKILCPEKATDLFKDQYQTA